MHKLLSRPKAFGEILDLTFQLSKHHFKDFIKIFLILIGPIYLLEAIIHMASGVSFFREVAEGANWVEQMINNLDDMEGAAPVSLVGDVWLIVLGLVSILLSPIAWAAVLFAVNHIRKGEEFTVGSVIKQGFSRFWQIFFSNILFIILLLGLLTALIVIITIFTIGGGIVDNLVVAILFGFLIWMGTFLGIGLIATRISFYFGSVVIDRISPGIIRSWQLTRRRTWALFGLFIVFSVIIGMISFAFDMTFGAFLGNSVLSLMISNFVLLVTTMLTAVAYAVVFLDLKTRNNADDLKEMIDDYHDNKK